MTSVDQGTKWSLAQRRVPLHRLDSFPLRLVCFAAAIAIAAPLSAAIRIEFDYRFDTQGFFNPPARRTALEAAADVFETRVLDTLSPIVPQGGNTWEAVINHPQSGSEANVANPVVAGDTLLIFVGARDLGSTTVGKGGPGGWSARGFSQTWFDTIRTRGEPNSFGNTATDFGPWGGSIAFDTRIEDGSARNWHFGLNSPPPGTTDFFTTAVHEIAHVLGIGTSDSWRYLVQSASDTFTGAASVAEYGGPVPLAPGESHWQNGTRSTIPITGESGEALMDPSQQNGRRKLFTRLDFAGLDDIGWEISPEPAPLAADFNLDGYVDLNDFTVLKDNFGSNAAKMSDGDANLDGQVDLNDFNLLKDQFGQSAAAVPEPGSVVLACFAAAALVVMARRSRR